jgi:Asp-tRNA(Asn)/Glu-tRNA(Gln) amidotransferase A subunit family amidase
MKLSLLPLSLLAITLVSFTGLANPSAPHRLHQISAAQALQQMQNKQLSSVELTQYYLGQIDKNNLKGAEIRAIVDINRDAIKLATRLDAERKAGKIRGPLHGLPVVLKANIATKDGMPTTAGALALKGFLTKKDAELVSQLRQAGAVILAKSNLSEWANFRGEGSASGWSLLGGQTKNPYVLTQSPCGSSSGSGVAVAADMTLFAVGTETDGSITCPAAVNGIVGIKPTHGAVSGAGIIPIAASQDIAGPMARSVADAALLLDSLATAEATAKYGQSLNIAATQMPVMFKKVVLVRAYDQKFPAIRAMQDKVAATLTAQGIEVVQINSWDLPEQLGNDELTVLIYEFKRDLNQWLTEYQASPAVNTIEKIVELNEKKGKAALAFYGQQYLQQASQIDLVADAKSYQQALSNSQKLAAAMLDQYLVTAGADAILLPATTAAWAIDHVKGDNYSFGTSTAAAVAGYPSITIPAGMDGELPLGLSIVGAKWAEPKLISVAAMLEQQLPARKTPKFLSK